MASTTESTHSVFLDGTKRRKWYFRTGTVVCFGFLFLCIMLFLFGISISTAKNKPLTYQDAIERYHFYYSAANHKKVAFTFDDGPNPPASNVIMDALEAADAPATFFFVGKQVLLRPDIVKEAVDRGFEVEDHSFTHAQSIHSSFSRMALELNSTQFLLSSITGIQPTFYRPPFLLGIGVDPTINPYIPVAEDMKWALQLGYLPVGSDLDTKDWNVKSPQDVIDNLVQALQETPNGHIVLLHDDKHTAGALPTIVEHLKSEGYRIVPLKELLTPPTEIALTGTMRYGDTDTTTNGDVSKLQWFLYTQKYLDAYALSGVFDTQTYNAVVDFQTTNKIVDASNPNPDTLGIVGPLTRNQIHEISLLSLPAPVAPPHGLVAVAWQALHSLSHKVVMTVYINLFPFTRATLQYVLTGALVLVIARSMGLFILLVYRAYKKRLPTEAGTEPVGATILIPAYNEQENIAATIGSVVLSTYQPREILVINDGSTDRTEEEVEAFIRANPDVGVRLITIPNGGKAKALNLGIAAAKYEIIVVLDADAVLERTAVERFMPHFKDPLVGAVAGKVRTTESSRFLDLMQTLEYAIGQNIDKAAFSTIGAVGVVPGPAGAWRKSFLVEAGGFHVDTLVEDQEMTLTLLRMGKKVIYEESAIAYTETPHTVKNFVKQRFRWVYGTMQAFWKHKNVMWQKPDSPMSLVVMPNIVVFNILLPLSYPFADSAFLFGVIFGEWQALVLPFILFTVIDLLYATWGLRGEPQKLKLMCAVPLQRVVYRQLLYYTVYKSVIRAFEGTGTVWNKFLKVGETKRFFLTALQTPVGHEVSPPKPDTVPEPALVPSEIVIGIPGSPLDTVSSRNENTLVV